MQKIFYIKFECIKESSSIKCSIKSEEKIIIKD